MGKKSHNINLRVEFNFDKFLSEYEKNIRPYPDDHLERIKYEKMVNEITEKQGLTMAVRRGKKVPAKLFHDYVILLENEYFAMVDEWGKRFTDEAIKQYDQRYPNSLAMRRHTDHNRGIRDYVLRGFICQGIKKELTPKREAILTPETEPLSFEEQEAAMTKFRELANGIGMRI